MKYFVFAVSFCLCLAAQSFAAVNIAPLGTLTSNANGVYLTSHLIDGFYTTVYYGTNAPVWLELELDQVRDLEYIEFYSQNGGASNPPNPDMTMKVYQADGTTQIGSTYTCSNGQASYVVDNGGAGYADVKYIRWDKPTGTFSLAEVEAYIDLTYISVDAGTDATVSAADPYQLDSTISDAHGPVSYEWSMYKGPIDGVDIAVTGTATGQTWLTFTPELALDGDENTFFRFEYR